ncbi:MAG TPA: hypothetical protein DIV86_04335 [Alphaproteobacteria bacterium]|nr:hypothetical protein [Alphaproteobacteria bacterium]
MKKGLYFILLTIIISSFPQVSAQDNMTDKEKQAYIVKLKASLDKDYKNIMNLTKKYRGTSRAAGKAEATKNAKLIREFGEKRILYSKLTGESYLPNRETALLKNSQRPDTGGSFKSSNEWISRIQEETYQTLGADSNYQSAKTCRN